MIVHLDSDVFEIVKNKQKNIEIRVNDEKRRKLKVGDELIFLKRPLEEDKLYADVTFLDYYDNFEQLVNYYDMKNLYLEDYTKEELLNKLYSFYNKKEIEKYGVVAIGFKLK